MLMFCADGSPPFFVYVKDNELGDTLRFGLAAATLNVKLWETLETLLVAVMVNGKLPETVGFPAKIALPLPLSAKVTPFGSEPHMDSVGVGVPEVVTVNDPATPTLKSAELALVIAGAV